MKEKPPATKSVAILGLRFRQTTTVCSIHPQYVYICMPVPAAFFSSSASILLKSFLFLKLTKPNSRPHHLFDKTAKERPRHLSSDSRRVACPYSFSTDCLPFNKSFFSPGSLLNLPPIFSLSPLFFFHTRTLHSFLLDIETNFDLFSFSLSKKILWPFPFFPFSLFTSFPAPFFCGMASTDFIWIWELTRMCFFFSVGGERVLKKKRKY